MHPNGRIFADLVSVMAINASAKRSRAIARQKGLSFAGFQRDFEAAVALYNAEVLRLRPIQNRPPRRN